MKKITNLEDLRYRKLYLRSEIKLKEQKIGTQLAELKEDLNSTDFKSEIMRTAMNNPAMVINVARLTYDLVIRLKKYKRRKKARKKARLSS
jgi:hypothetical protein